MTTLLDTLDPIFADCTGDEDGRYTLTKPWVRRAYVYATDGRIIVRQATQQPDTECPQANRPFPLAPHLMFDDGKPMGKSIPLPDIGPELGDKLICATCKGKDSTGTCKDCKGLGKHVCPTCKHEKPCGACDGEGTQCCLECGGAGTIARKRQPVKLQPKHEFGLADYYVWLLGRHGIETVRKAKTPDWPMGLPAFCFRKGKIEGLVMGMALGGNDDG